MPAPRKDEQAEAMYRLYLKGFSMAKVASAFSVTRQSVFKAFRLRGYAIRKPKRLPFIVWRGMKYTYHDGYYRNTETKSRLHRDVWEWHNGPVPNQLHVHHKNGNRTDNRIQNLELIDPPSHGRVHANTNDGFKANRFKPGYDPRRR